jgi:hypothetical protein
MGELRKKRILALVIGTGLISIPLVLLWLDTPFFLRYWLFIPLILALIPGCVGVYAVVGLPFILLGTALTYPRRGVV